MESDGCFADGVAVATGATVGHRNMRVEDYGKVAAVFADTKTGKTRRYFAQLHGYQVMPLSEMFCVQGVVLRATVKETVSRPGVLVNCEMCGEEIINEREIQRDGFTLCRVCAGEAFYQPNGILIHFTPVNV